MSKSHPSHYNAVSLWLLSHCRAFLYAVNEFVRTPVASMVTLCVIGIALALPLGFFVLLQNFQDLNSRSDMSTPSISLYLRTDIDQSQVNSLLQSLQQNPQIAQVSYISPEAGLKTFEKNTPFGDAVKLLQNNPIPGVIVILPTAEYQNPAAMQTLYDTLKILPTVDTAQLDMSWVTRLYNILAIAKQCTKALSILFGLTVVLIISHTLRTSLASHTKEIQVLKLIGATHAYIRRPLLYRGILYGFLGAIIAWIVINLFIFQLQDPVSTLAQTYHAPFTLQDVSASEGLLVLFLSGLLGYISAWIITMRFLNQTHEQME